MVEEFFEEVAFGLCAEVDSWYFADNRVEDFLLLRFFICYIIEADQERAELDAFDLDA